MATLYANETGEILRLIQDEIEAKMFPDPPPETVYTLELDLSANPELAASLNSDWQCHSMPEGVLCCNEEPVTIAAPCQAFVDRSQIAELRQKLDADESLTQSEIRVLLRYVLDKISA